ncbi:hypothetical protein DFH09DRAFT_1185095, partial [Mycena vulgaris]
MPFPRPSLPPPFCVDIPFVSLPPFSSSRIRSPPSASLPPPLAPSSRPHPRLHTPLIPPSPASFCIARRLPSLPASSLPSSTPPFAPLTPRFAHPSPPTPPSSRLRPFSRAFPSLTPFIPPASFPVRLSLVRAVPTTPHFSPRPLLPRLAPRAPVVLPLLALHSVASRPSCPCPSSSSCLARTSPDADA